MTADGLREQTKVENQFEDEFELDEYDATPSPALEEKSND